MNTPRISSLLIVEDDPMVRRLLVRHFQKKYGVVREAPDAELALAAFREGGSFDVVVTDVHLPGMTGVDMATQIRQIRHDQPIVFVTGDVDEDLARRALEGGSAGYLLKPFEFFELDAAIAQALNAPPLPAAPPPAVFTPGQASNEWYDEQRRQLMAAAARPVALSAEYPTWHRSRFGLYLKIAVVVLVLVGIAWVVGYGLFPEHKDSGPVPSPTTRESENNTVYVPYTPPPAPDQTRDRDKRR